MDSGSQAAAHGGNGKSGGKILKRRQIAARKSPYDRPTMVRQNETPYWINALVFPAKFVASGANKLFSSFWKPKSWSSHSSSLESDSDSGGIEDDFKRDKNLHDGDAELNRDKGSSSRKSEILYLIEQLLMLECFSREECDRLMKIINLRVVDHVMREGVNAGRINPKISKKVIMEARNTIAENPVESSLKSDLDYSIHGSKSLVTLNRDYRSGGSQNIHNEVQRSHSKAIVLVKPNKPEAPKPDRRATQYDVSTKALSSLPTIKEKYQIAYEKDLKDDKGGDNANRVEENCDMITEYAEVADVIHASQGSSNTNDPTALTRTRKYNTRKGRPRAK